MRYRPIHNTAAMLGVAFVLSASACDQNPCTHPDTNVAKTTTRKDQWRLEDLYPSILHWEQNLQDFIKQVDSFKQITQSSIETCQDLHTLLSTYHLTKMRYERLLAYASLKKDLDVTDKRAHSLYARIIQYNGIMESIKTSFESSVLTIPPSALHAFFSDARIKPFQHAIMKIHRMKRRRFSLAKEQFIARSHYLSRMISDAYQSLWELELPYEEIDLGDGQSILNDAIGFARFRALPDRVIRARVFYTFFKTFHRFRDTMAVFIQETVERYSLYTHARGYRSNLQAALDQSAIPTNVYTRMIEQVHAALPLFKRYLKLRKRLLGLEQLAYHDMYISMVPGEDVHFSWQDAQNILQAATQPLGPQYQQIVNQALQANWFDVLPSREKKPGAYCLDFVYGSHPFVLINFTGDFDSLSSSLHEFGHASQGYLSNKYQTYQNAHYSQFLSEIAAITNEHLLSHYLISKQTDPKRRLYFLCQYLDRWRQILFRQCQFAEFELRVHTASKQGVAINATILDKIYLDLLNHYHGKNEGITNIDPIYASEWAFVQEFQEGFFVYQYVTSFIISRLICNRIISGDQAAREKYLTLLKSGDSDYPLNLLKIVEIDITKSQPYKAAFHDYQKLLEEAENLASRLDIDNPTSSSTKSGIVH